MISSDQNVCLYTNVLVYTKKKSVHSELPVLTNVNGHKVRYNVPNEPDMNPIEFTIGSWITISKKIVSAMYSKMEITRKLSEMFTGIPSDEVQRRIFPCPKSNTDKNKE